MARLRIVLPILLLFTSHVPSSYSQASFAEMDPCGLYCAEVGIYAKTTCGTAAEGYRNSSLTDMLCLCVSSIFFTAYGNCTLTRCASNLTEILNETETICEPIVSTRISVPLTTWINSVSSALGIRVLTTTLASGSGSDVVTLTSTGTPSTLGASFATTTAGAASSRITDGSSAQATSSPVAQTASSGGLSNGAVAGIAVGVALLAVIAAGFGLFYFLKRRNVLIVVSDPEPSNNRGSAPNDPASDAPLTQSPNEYGGGVYNENTMKVDGQQQHSELEGNPALYELGANEGREMR
ncbi:hypothetical protein RUND412_007829 [Rhizina undulata]